MDTAVQSAFVIVLAWALGLGAQYLPFPIDPVVINSVAGSLVIYIVSKLFPSAVRKLLGK